jgi:RHS repeat-associated protein
MKAQVTASIGGTAQSVTQYSYDGWLHPICTAVRQNTAVFGSLPDACTQSTSGSYGYDQITQNNYDAAGRLSTVQTGVGSGTAITVLTNHYDSYGRIDTVTDANGNQSNLQYDAYWRLNEIDFPDPSTGTPNCSPTCHDSEQYGYDLQSNMTSKALRSPSHYSTPDTISYSYDELNRLSYKDGGSGDRAQYCYDVAGDVLEIYDASGCSSGTGLVMAWDALGRKTQEDSYGSGHRLSYQYDAAGNRTRLTWSDSTYVQYTYDILNRMQDVKLNGTGTALATYSYDNLGRVAGIARSNSVSTSASYNSTSQSWSLATSGSSQDVTYGMDYSPAGQLTSRSINNSNYRYSYTSSNVTTPYCPNGLNQYATVGGSGGSCSGGQTFTYDDRGNLTDDGPRSFSYDLDNKLSAVSGSASMTLGYDPTGRLQTTTASSSTEQYVYDGGALVVEYDNAGAIQRRYVPGAGMDETLVWYEGAGTSNPHWLHTDEQGTTIATSTGGATATPYVYSPTGEPTSWSSVGSAPAFRYTGQVALPQVQLMYYKARMYDPGLGRFLQTDPAGYSAGMNLYAYVTNNYPNAVDPSGLCIVVYPDGSWVNTTNCETVKSEGTQDKDCKNTLCFSVVGEFDPSSTGPDCLHLDIQCGTDAPPKPFEKPKPKANMCPEDTPATKLGRTLIKWGSVLAGAGATTATIGAFVDAIPSPPTWVTGTTGFALGLGMQATGLAATAAGMLLLNRSGHSREAIEGGGAAVVGAMMPDALSLAPALDPSESISKALANRALGPNACP